MSASAQSRTLVDTGGLVVADDGRHVLVIDRGTGRLIVLAFVHGVVALIAGGFGLVTIVVDDGLPTALSVAFLAAGLLVALEAVLTYRRVTRLRTRPLQECRPVAVLDRQLGLFSGGGGTLIPLDQVRFARVLQIGSSSPKLVALTPSGTRVLKRGNPFDGGIGNADEVLNDVAHGADPSARASG
jgi:hypothetical protein